MSETNDPLMDKLIEFEEIEDGSGWDQLPSLMFLSMDGDKVAVEVLAVIDAPSYPNLYDAFYQMAMDPPKPAFTPIAVAFCVEGWAPPMPEGLSRADQKAFMATYPYKRFADDPDRKEVRNLVAVTADGKRYDIGRERGREPKASMHDLDQTYEVAKVLGVSERGIRPLKMLLAAWTGGAS